MMKDGIIISQRDIVLISFPFADLNYEKKRPVIIISNFDYNKRNSDFICCAITSNLRNYQNSIEISNSDLEKGFLKFKSNIKVNKIFTLEQIKIEKWIGRLKINKSMNIIENINSILNIN
ncbi:MAG: type II toxin-antitoxin system PemK/MazF family toxin [Candidatus Nanoarchaeia archaeon]|nr:type II toxin-antitoxin system PemK/MazF family toxin [Candidatus Nanoarchaeia archaeon]